MNIRSISEKFPALLAIVVGLGFLGMAYLDARYRFFHLAVALVAFWYGSRRFSRKETPFEKREREMRRNFH